MVGRGCCDWRPQRRRARPGRQPLSQREAQPAPAPARARARARARAQAQPCSLVLRAGPLLSLLPTADGGGAAVAASRAAAASLLFLLVPVLVLVLVLVLRTCTHTVCESDVLQHIRTHSVFVSGGTSPPNAWDRLGGRLAAVRKLAMSARANGAGAAARAGG